MTLTTRMADDGLVHENGPGRRGEPIYLQHFAMHGQPFRLTPGIDCFYEGAERGRVLAAIAYALVHGDGIVLLTGAIGSGKSTLARVLMARAMPRIKFIYVSNPAITARELLEVMADELSLNRVIDTPSSTLTRHIQKRLIALHAGGRQVVVLVDEAQEMPVDTLQQLRLMSNLETSVQKLLQVVLVGQPELNDQLQQPALHPLRERIAHRFQVKPLTEADIRRYLVLRLRQAGGDPALFGTDATRLISQYSGGVARRINLLADKCLLAAYMDGSVKINAGHVREALSDVAFQFGLEPTAPGKRGLPLMPSLMRRWFGQALRPQQVNTSRST